MLLGYEYLCNYGHVSAIAATKGPELEGKGGALRYKDIIPFYRK